MPAKDTTTKMDDEERIMDEADEEHHVAKVLIAELEKMEGDEDHWEAKFTVLAESIRHHIKEEEGTMFKEAKKTDIDFDVLGSQMAPPETEIDARRGTSGRRSENGRQERSAG